MQSMYSALYSIAFAALTACGAPAPAQPPHAAATATSSSAPAEAARTARLTVPIEGMACENCAANITRALKRLEGVQDAAVHFEKKQVTVAYDESKLTPARIVAEIDKLGFKAGTPVKG